MGRVVKSAVMEAASKDDVVGGLDARRFTPDVRREYLRLLSQGTLRHKAARMVKVDPRTVVLAKKADPTFAELCVLAEEEFVEGAEQKLYDAVEKGEPWAIQMVLKNRDAERWGDRRKVEVDVGVTVELGDRLGTIEMLKARLEERRALSSGSVGGAEEILEAEILD